MPKCVNMSEHSEVFQSIPFHTKQTKDSQCIPMYAKVSQGKPKYFKSRKYMQNYSKPCNVYVNSLKLI